MISLEAVFQQFFLLLLLLGMVFTAFQRQAQILAHVGAQRPLDRRGSVWTKKIWKNLNLYLTRNDAKNLRFLDVRMGNRYRNVLYASDDHKPKDLTSWNRQYVVLHLFEQTFSNKNYELRVANFSISPSRSRHFASFCVTLHATSRHSKVFGRTHKAKTLENIIFYVWALCGSHESSTNSWWQSWWSFINCLVMKLKRCWPIWKI